jgi:hypothetical protein
MTNSPDAYLLSVICYLSSVICHLLSVICYLLSVIRDELQASTGWLFYHIDPHLPSSTYQGPIGGFLGAGVHILDLDLNDRHDVFFRQLADFRFAGLFGAGRDIRGFLQQDRCRWRFGDEGKRFIFINGDNDRQNIASLFLSSGVKLFAERHDINTVLTQGGSNRRCWVRLPGRDLKLNRCDDFLCHVL